MRANNSTACPGGQTDRHCPNVKKMPQGRHCGDLCHRTVSCAAKSAAPRFAQYLTLPSAPVSADPKSCTQLAVHAHPNRGQSQPVCRIPYSFGHQVIRTPGKAQGTHHLVWLDSLPILIKYIMEDRLAQVEGVGSH
jgi:hypothetical protein